MTATVAGQSRESGRGSGLPGPAHTGADVERMLAVVDRLAANDFGGRRVGSPGGKAAADWLAAHLDSLGATVTVDGFPIRGAVKELAATPILRWRGADLVHRRDFAEHLACAYTPMERAGRIAPAGEADVEGAWVLLDAFAAEQVGVLAQRGALGVLLPRGTDDAGWMPKMIAGPGTTALPVVSVRSDLYQKMKLNPSAVSASIPLSTVDVAGLNVHGVFRAAPAHGPSVLLTAHFDGVGDDPGGVRFPAAADNASGVAVILQAAQQLYSTLRPAGVGLAVALLDGEEAGAHGSAHHAPRVRPGTHVINVDGAAQLHEAAAVEAGGPAMPLLRALDLAGRDVGVPLRARAMPSDNRRYAAAGLPAIGIGMGLPGYQTPAETPDRVEPATLLKAAGLVVAAVERLVGALLGGSVAH